jgi:AraC-like DNA-binding protein
MPFSWLYFRETLDPGKRSWKDLFHLLPVLIYIIDYLPFFFLSGQEKMEILHSLNNYGVKARFGEGWFMPAGGHNLIRYTTMLGYWFVQGRLLMRTIVLSNFETGGDFAKQRKWLICLHFSELLIFIPAIITLLMGRIDLMVAIYIICGLLAGLIQGSFLLMNPEVLYGIPVELNNQTEDDSVLFSKNDSTGNVTTFKQSTSVMPAYIENLDEALLDKIGVAIEKVMKEKNIYLDPGLKISDLAFATGFISYKLSAYFNKRCNQSFNDFVNQKRVEHCIQKLDSGENMSKTLEGISLESGFQSRSTFIRAFKKFKGMTPSEYIEGGKER